MRRHIIIFIGAIMAIMVYLASCTEAVELCEVKGYPHAHFSDLRVTYDWTDYDRTTKPDSMLIFAERLVGRWNCGYAIDLSTNKGEYLYNAFGDAEPVIEDGNTVYSVMKVHPGQYAVMTFSRSTEEFDYHGIDEYFIDRSDSTNLDSIYIQYRPYDKDDPELKRYLSSWTDFNPYSQYVQSDSHPFLYAVSDVLKCDAEASQSIVFHPKNFMQRITFSFNIEKKMEEDSRFEIDSIHLEISGVPYRFYFMSGNLDVKKTYKMLTKPIYIEDKDSYSNRTLNCEAYFNAPGIVPPVSTQTALGPGIAVAKVYLHTAKNPDKAYMVNARINLFNTISKSPMIKMNDDMTKAVLRGQYHLIEVTQPLRINAQAIIDSEEGGDGNDRWEQCGPGTIIDI